MPTKRIATPETALAAEPTAALAAAAEPQSYRQLIQMAVENRADVQVLRDLYALQKDFEADEARKAFYQAMAAFQAECPPVRKTRRGAKATYAPLEDIEEVIKPYREKHGLWISYHMERQGSVLCGWATVAHVHGHKEDLGHQSIEYLEPVMSRGGGTAMNRTQADAGTITYLKRYILAAALNLTFQGEDTDGTYVDGPVTAEQLQDLSDLLKQSKYTVKQWLSVAVAKPEDLSEHQAKRLLARMREQGPSHGARE